MSGSGSSASSDGNYELKITETYGGGKGPVRWSFTEDSCIARVDVPGCPDVPVPSNFRFEETYVGFQMKEVAMDPNVRTVREYVGCVRFDSTIYNVMEAKIKIANGVFRVTAPKKIN
ncbi:hypothetical protein CARUB_v10011551mg [Capsella rubella]|uniref:SHSP domain-containing protein n=1 Tax=Capsella rubella TaxID=81985 RepID=R0I9F7_9BRAS|nr:14.7 kDa heat shock protein [Capsella rubella]EOA39009.1 hypothetical protein CARUB_v10011551mg [Capsella rubella]